MGKRTGSMVAVAAVALLVVGLAYAVMRLYEQPQTPGSEEVSSAGSVLMAVPTDAAAVFLFDGSAKAARVLADSTGILRAVIDPENPGMMPFLQALGRRKLAVSLHNSGSLVPLVVAEVQQDSLLGVLASGAGLKTMNKNGLLLASRSETFINAAARHLESGASVLGTRQLHELVKTTGGPAVLYVAHSQAGKLMQVYAGKAYRPYSSFVRDLTAWSAWTLQPSTGQQIAIKGTALPSDEASSFFAAVKDLPTQDAAFPDVLPYFTGWALSLPVPDVDAFLESRRKAEDGAGRLAVFNKDLKAKAGRPLSPEAWFRSLQPREVVRAAFRTEDGLEREALLVRSGKDLKLGRGDSTNRYAGCLALLLGENFRVVDTVCASVNKSWSVYADAPTVRAFADKAFLDYTLRSRLADASVQLPQGFVAYASLGDAPLLGSLLSPTLAAPLQRFITGAGYAPATASLVMDEDRPDMRLSLETRVLKGSKVQVLERDTTVVIPAGYFPVVDFRTGQTNYLYQNNHLSICLNDENGKGVWGIPFKEPLCGRVQCIDYYQTKKIQFLFAAGDQLYLLDRLGHWVKDFPARLPKPVLLGPDVYDFTGVGGYTVMILHKDNTLERYNLHGQKPEGWKGIKGPETIKNLPELVETTKGKRYWAVRTSVRTLIYPFEGGEPLVAGEGGKMIKPDAVLTATAKGVSAECYDGKTRDFKLN